MAKTGIDTETRHRKGRGTWGGWMWVLVSVAVIMLAGLTLLLTRSGEDPVATTLPMAHTEQGWIAFPAAGPYANIDLYMVGLGRPAFRVAFDGPDSECPAFSPDGTQLAHGQANGTLIVSDVGVDGSLSETFRVERRSSSISPCPTWSPNGDMIAAGVREEDEGRESSPGDIWLVSVGDRTPTVLEDMYAHQSPEPSNLWSDMEWSPDGTELAITQKRGIMLYSLAEDEWRILNETVWARHLTWSPDGTQIAYEVGHNSYGVELQVAKVDGTGRHTLASEYGTAGMGPVWSPSGDQIVFQRDCFYSFPNDECPWEDEVVHEVVLVTPEGDEQVLPDLTVPGDDRIWWPFRVSWSPDGSHLLYLAYPHRTDNPDGFPEYPQVAPPALIARPIDLASPPVLLYQGPMEGSGEGSQLAVQSWGQQVRDTSN